MIVSRKIFKYLLFAGLSGMLFIVVLRVYIISSTKKVTYSSSNEVPFAYTALVLGAHVSKSGLPSHFLKDRLDIALELYKEKKVKKLLLSGDHGTVIYDEVNNMRDYLLERGVPTEDIFLDHAGFDTYNSVVRADKIFEVKEMVIVTQEFHLPRALFIANGKKLKAYGMIADRTNYGSLTYLRVRETIAGVKAFFEVLINKKPRYLGEKIPITGNSSKSYDR